MPRCAGLALCLPENDWRSGEREYCERDHPEREERFPTFGSNCGAAPATVGGSSLELISDLRGVAAMSMFNRIIHVKRRVVGLTTILLFFLAIAVTVSAGCMETEKRLGQPAVEEARPDDAVSPPSQGTNDGSEVGGPKAVDVHSPGVPVTKDEYRKMKDGASSRP